jgi:hypothetical protein
VDGIRSGKCRVELVNVDSWKEESGVKEQARVWFSTQSSDASCAHDTQCSSFPPRHVISRSHKQIMAGPCCSTQLMSLLRICNGHFTVAFPFPLGAKPWPATTRLTAFSPICRATLLLVCGFRMHVKISPSIMTRFARLASQSRTPHASCLERIRVWQIPDF